MYKLKLPQFLVFILLIINQLGCAKPPSVSEGDISKAKQEINEVSGRQIADLIAADVVRRDEKAIFSRLPKEIRDTMSADQILFVFDSLDTAYGRLEEYKFKKDFIGKWVSLSGSEQPMRKYWYAAKTSKHDFGTVFLTVSIVPDKDGLGCSAFEMVVFPEGTPDHMK